MPMIPEVEALSSVQCLEAVRLLVAYDLEVLTSKTGAAPQDTDLAAAVTSLNDALLALDAAVMTRSTSAEPGRAAELLTKTSALRLEGLKRFCVDQTKLLQDIWDHHGSGYCNADAHAELERRIHARNDRT